MTISQRFRLLLTGFVSAGALLFVPGVTWAAQFTGGPSVRVADDIQIEFEWITDVSWFGKIEIFANPDGTGTPVLSRPVTDPTGFLFAAAHQDIIIPVVAPLQPNSGYYFRVTASDPAGIQQDFSTPTPLPPVFTGGQQLFNVAAQSITTNSATIAWSANVIGFGRVVYGASNQTVQDAFNITDHALDLTGLSPSTTYQFTASNLHAIDGNSLASQSGQFTTASPPITVVLTKPNADPRVIGLNQVSTVSVRVQSQNGTAVSGVSVGFVQDASSAGGGVLAAAQANTDSNGMASVQFTATRRGLVQINVFPPASGINSLTIPIVVR
jgi:hypothetical protein